MLFENLLVFILFQFKKRPNISSIRVALFLLYFTINKYDEHKETSNLFCPNPKYLNIAYYITSFNEKKLNFDLIRLIGIYFKPFLRF